ncbi:alpha/beta fold hydrolase [Streptomyces sp. V1I1]|uniref:alpha/beta fold hydrolase n=1 Tax=Streptomyces sp. V1I1 TaxID=3042272 RepID=UPI0027D8D628|nr:alpha/beta hydrolase [Streptomyces sp. V1I1]
MLSYHLTGEGEPLIVLPGGAMRASAYLGDLGGLSAHRQLVLLDLRGTGDSAVPADPATYRCDRQVADVEALSEHLGLARMDVLALSAGGNLALLYAAQYPERIGRLALLTPMPGRWGSRRRRSSAVRRHCCAATSRGLKRRTPPSTPRSAEASRTAPSSRSSTGGGARRLRRMPRRAMGSSTPEAAARYGSEGAFDPPATRAALTELDAAVLVMAGELDGVPTPERAGEPAALFPDGEVVVQPDGGHFPWLDDPDWCVRTVIGFLAR